MTNESEASVRPASRQEFTESGWSRQQSANHTDSPQADTTLSHHFDTRTYGHASYTRLPGKKEKVTTESKDITHRP